MPIESNHEWIKFHLDLQEPNILERPFCDWIIRQARYCDGMKRSEGVSTCRNRLHYSHFSPKRLFQGMHRLGGFMVAKQAYNKILEFGGLLLLAVPSWDKQQVSSAESVKALICVHSAIKIKLAMEIRLCTCM